MEATASDGTTIGWDESGDGRPLLLVHGGAVDAGSWSLVRPLLPTGLRVASMDRRGRGRSGRGGEPHSLEVEADDVLVVARALGGDVLVVGHSIGATIALQALRRSDDLITGAVLYEPPLPAMVPAAPAAMITALDDERFDDALEIFLREMVRLPAADLAAFRASPAWPMRVKLIWTMRREAAALADHDPDLAQYRAIGQPVELLLGDRTAPHHTAAIHALQPVLPSAHTTVLAGQGHGALLQAPQRIATSITEHLALR
ncbi:MAG: alpha/beta fold hydrolase [Acidimicrobiales bacterium]